MSQIVVLVSLPAEDEDAGEFRKAIEASTALNGQVELRFAKGDGILEAIRDAEVVVCGNLSSEQIDAAVKLRWISFWSAGVDGKITDQITERRFLVTNASGVHGPNIAEHVMAFMLMFTRQLNIHARAQVAGEWRRNGNTQRRGAEELTGTTLGIVGLGRIGEALAHRAKAFGMRVIATKRDLHSRYDPRIEVDQFFPPDHLPELLALSDHVCIALPYTEQTHCLFNAEMLAHMKPSAYLYNIARGKIVDEAALIDALQNERLAGAGLDVFEIEPLPADSPLWQMENVIISPHTSGLTPHYFTRAANLFAENLARYLNGYPLYNQYDPRRGY
jgi:phosphoglycerate dehydrogenase-like enzyme